MKQKKISQPDFKDREKEAKFWEGHFDETWAAGNPIKVKFAKNLSEGLHIRLDPETLLKLRKKANEKGIGPTTLARMWIKENLYKSGMVINDK